MWFSWAAQYWRQRSELSKLAAEYERAAVELDRTGEPSAGDYRSVAKDLWDLLDRT